MNNNDKTRTNRTSIRATDSQPASDTTSAKVNRRSLRTVTPFPFEVVLTFNYCMYFPLANVCLIIFFYPFEKVFEENLSLER